MKRIRVFISGRVQGVWFRESTKVEALEQGVCGWVRNLPDAVEAIFVVECDGSRRNTAYAASRTCEQARAKARQVHAAYLAKTGRASSGFPLLRLRPDNWAEPFVSDC